MSIYDNLRPYQQEAVDAATAWMRSSIMPGLLELATGAGKSWIIAAIADWIYRNSGKRVLCLQPSKELTEQNAEKYRSTGQPCSIFSASISKCMRHNVVYATPGTVKNSLSRFGDAFAAVIIDEAHSTTATHRLIIDSIRRKNPNLRVIGLSGTPYRTGSGFIYQYDVDGSFVPEDQAREPYYNRLLYRIQTQDLIDAGYLTPIHADPELAAQYDTSGLQLNSRGQFDKADVERTFEGRGRITSEIVADVVHHSRGRRGVMLFAATVQHAKEIMESLPPENARMVGGDVNMRKSERERVIEDFKAQKFKYIVSVGTLTTGFDAPHVDVVAVLRKTESPGLFQQIIGRGLRLYEGKVDCLLLDYAGNVEFHQLEDNLFQPEVRVRRPSESGPAITAVCPDCGYENEFTARQNPDGFGVDDNGYFLDAANQRIDTPNGPMPAHYGRRCCGQVPVPGRRGEYERCPHRWSIKECPECGHENDIAARFCEQCKEELVDPGEKLRRDFIRIKKDPYSTSTDAVLDWSARPHTSMSGKETVLCEYTTEYRKFKAYYTPDSRHPIAQRAWKTLCEAVYKGHVAPDVQTFIKYLDKGEPPKTITYRRQRGSKFYDVLDHNQPEDRIP